MLRQVFQSLGGIDGFGIISMLIFIVFFTLVVIHVIRLDRAEIEDCSRIPFDESLKESEKNV